VTGVSKFFRRRPNVEVLTMVLVVFVALAALGCASLIWGMDSRDPYADDHIR